MIIENFRFNDQQKNSTADDLSQNINRGGNAGLCTHGEIFHFKGNITIIAHHMDNGEEFLPPIQVMAAAHSHIIPNTLCAVSDRPRLQDAVHIGEQTFNARAAAMGSAPKIII